MKTKNESGIALITALLILVLMGTMITVLVIKVNSNQRIVSNERLSEGRSATVAEIVMQEILDEAGKILEESPRAIDLVALFDKLSYGVSAADGKDEDGKLILKEGGEEIGVDVNIEHKNAGKLVDRTITEGIYKGLTAQIDAYTIEVTAVHKKTGNMSKLKSSVEIHYIPVFQFGAFFDSDMAFYPGSMFNFGGRVHTNKNLYLGNGGSAMTSLSSRLTTRAGYSDFEQPGGGGLRLSDAVSAVLEIKTQQRPNLFAFGNSHYVYIVSNINVESNNGTTTTTTTYRQLNKCEGNDSAGCTTTTPNYPDYKNNPDYWRDGTNTQGAGSVWPKYNNLLNNGNTGASELKQPVVIGTDARKIDIIKRGKMGGNPEVEKQRFFSLASLRILLSDEPEDLQSPYLPGGLPSGSTPIELKGQYSNTGAASYYFASVPNTCESLSISTDTTINDAYKSICNAAAASNCSSLNTAGTVNGTNKSAICNAVVATPSNTCSGNTIASANRAPCTTIVNAVTEYKYYQLKAGTPLIGGYILIQKQNANGSWQDVTEVILDRGVTGAGVDKNNARWCSGNASSGAIIRLQRFADGTTNCTNSAAGTNLWPNTLYDAREGSTTYWGTLPPLTRNGVMHYVELDIGELSDWLSKQGDIKDNNGYVVYFSDRRGGRDGKYGLEHVGDQDLNEDGEFLMNTKGKVTVPSKKTTYGSDTVSTLTTNELNDANMTPMSYFSSSDAATAVNIAKRTRPIFFRRALKLVNGRTINLGPNNNVTPSVPYGLTIASENPLYVKGDYNYPDADNHRPIKPSTNCNGCGTNQTAVKRAEAWAEAWANVNTTSEKNFRNNGIRSGGSVPAAVVADAVTLLSESWNDSKSFEGINNTLNRMASPTFYRTAIISGTHVNFPRGSSSSTANPPGFTYPPLNSNVTAAGQGSANSAPPTPSTSYTNNTHAGRCQIDSSEWGTDGGVHNFLRLLEHWGNAANTCPGANGEITPTPVGTDEASLFYRGSFVSLYYSDQATSPFKIAVYSQPARRFSYEEDFRNIDFLPPQTLKVRGMNTLSITLATGDR